MPISRRLDPVMLARASEHGEASVAPGGTHAAPWAATAEPALPANTTSTAYSGSTAMKASTAMANPAEMSSWAASAAHDRRNAAPTTAAPNTSASIAWSSVPPPRRRTRAGTVAATAIAIEICWRRGRTSRRSSAVEVTQVMLGEGATGQRCAEGSFRRCVSIRPEMRCRSLGRKAFWDLPASHFDDTTSPAVGKGTPAMTPDQERDFIERQVNKDISRRKFIEWAGKAGIGSAAAMSLSGAVLAACSSGGGSKTIAGASGDTLKVGVIAPFSGIGAFIGTVTTNSLSAAVQELNARGGVLGRKIALVNRDTGIDPANGVKAYNELAGDPNIVGILWCGGLGFEQTQAQFARDRLPVMAVFDDAWSDKRLYPDDPNQRSVFQFLIPTRMAMDVLMKYAKEDRGYTSAALVNDVVIDPRTQNQGYFNAACQKYGVRSAGYESYQLGN